MFFERITKPDTETLKLFILWRKNFIYSSKSAIKQLRKIIKNSVFFYKVYNVRKDFQGCLFVDSIDDKNKIIEFGGFAKRHAQTTQSMIEFIAYFKHYYPDYQIKAITNKLTARISLVRAGFKKIMGDYIYD